MTVYSAEIAARSNVTSILVMQIASADVSAFDRSVQGVVITPETLDLLWRPSALCWRPTIACSANGHLSGPNLGRRDPDVSASRRSTSHCTTCLVHQDSFFLSSILRNRVRSQGQARQIHRSSLPSSSPHLFHPPLFCVPGLGRFFLIGHEADPSYCLALPLLLYHPIRPTIPTFRCNLLIWHPSNHQQHRRSNLN